MLRTVGGVVLGYLVMAVLVFGGLSAAWALMGAERAFLPGVYDVSPLWIATSIVLGFGAALIGGVVVRRIAGTTNATRALALLVVVLGVAMVLPVLTADVASVAIRTGAPSMFEAMGLARTPTWVMLLNPVIGAIGVLVGGGALAGGRATATVRA